MLRACRELGISTVAVHSTADANAMHVRLADESVCIGPPSARDSYLNIPAIVAACEITGAEAVHPGYGFLAENARFAEILAEHGITFIGPSAEHIRTMGDKIEAKRTAQVLGIPVVPGSDGAVPDVAAALRLGAEIGYPVLIKAAAGGGGRGMKVARSPEDMEVAYRTAQSEAKASFGDDAVYIEKFLGRPRHIEIQVFGDGQGRAVHLGERDCSLQRRHQKVWEEALSPGLNASQREQIGERVATAMAKLGYSGAGTVEFLYENGEFYFIEMNTRLQVEHPVTEMITGHDLVQEQIRIAAGAKLPFSQKDITFSGHAIECRINAENPKTFAPSPGLVDAVHVPGGLGVRVDSALYAGYRIPPYYDSLIGKLIVFGKTRTECLMRLRRALGEYVIEGVETTIPLFQELLTDPDIIDGRYNIHWLEQFLSRLKLDFDDDDHTADAAARLCRRHLPDGRERRGQRPLLGGAGGARGASSISSMSVAACARRSAAPPTRSGSTRNSARSSTAAPPRRSGGRTPGSMAASARCTRSSTGSAAATRSKPGDMGVWSAGSMASGSVGPFSASRCSRASAMPARWRWFIWSRGSTPADFACSTPNSPRRICALGAIDVPRQDYHRLLEAAIQSEADFLAFGADDPERVLELAVANSE